MNYKCKKKSEVGNWVGIAILQDKTGANKKRQLKTAVFVGARGFEPPTPWSRTRCSTRLSHAPKKVLSAKVLSAC